MAIKWHWNEYPIGFPLEDSDHDLAGPRTPSKTSLAIEYIDGPVWLRHAVMTNGLIEDLSLAQKHEMKRVLINWLRQRLALMEGKT